MRIAYIGPERGTANQRILALRRLGHDVTVIDFQDAVNHLVLPPALANLWAYRTGAFGLQGGILRFIRSQLKDARFDMVFVDHGETLGPAVIQEFRKAAKFVVNYNQDNPYVRRDGLKWRQYLKSVPYYDVVATNRLPSAEGAKRAGARRIVVVRMAADEAMHRPIEMSEADLARFSSKVAFVGTWMPERGPFLVRLIERGVPLRIFGERWTKAPEYPKLKPYFTRGHLEGDEYVKAVRGASIAIGLLSKGNEDLHTTRSSEIPAIGTLLCAERTSEHLEMYKDGEEAVFFDTPDECADICLDLLAHPERMKKIAAAGSVRVRQNGDFNEVILRKIIDAAIKS